jgi:hypothetical protein
VCCLLFCAKLRVFVFGNEGCVDEQNCTVACKNGMVDLWKKKEMKRGGSENGILRNYWV